MGAQYGADPRDRQANGGRIAAWVLNRKTTTVVTSLKG